MTHADLNKLTRELGELHKQMEDARNKAYQSMREVLAQQKYGGAAEKEDEHGVIRISVNAQGEPQEIRVEPEWEDHYEAAELTPAMTAVAQLIDMERRERTKEYLERHPDALNKITDQEVEAAFSETQQAGAAFSGDPVAVISDISERIPEAEAEVKALAASEQNALSGTEPVRVIVITGTLLTAVIDGNFAQEASNTKLNAEIAEAIQRSKNPASETGEAGAVQARLIRDGAQARAAAMSILSAFKAQRNSQ